MAREAVILSTCNRVELCGQVSGQGTGLFWPAAIFLDCHECREEFNDRMYILGEPQSVEHLFKVVCDLDCGRVAVAGVFL